VLTPQQRALYKAIRRAQGCDGLAHNLFRIGVEEMGQEYHTAYRRLELLEELNLVRVSRQGKARSLTLTICQEEPHMSNQTIIALDPGFGNTKVCVNGKISILQSAVARPVSIGLAAAGMKTADSVRHVEFDSFEFVVGQGAWRWGQALGSMDYAGLVGPERLALMYAGFAEVAKPGDWGECYLVIGLPVPLMQDQAQMVPILDALKRLKREHVFTSEDKEWRFTITGIKALAQPVGAFMDWLYNKDLLVREGAMKSEVAVVDLGMNTLDLFVVERGQVRPGFLGGEKVGVRRLLNLLSNNGYELAELDSMLRDGRLKAREAEIEIWLGEVLGAIERTWPSLKRFNAVIPAGGGAAMLDSKLTGALAAKGAAIYWPDDPVAANVRGLWKYGVKHVAQK